jgi:hypothetical protein
MRQRTGKGAASTVCVRTPVSSLRSLCHSCSFAPPGLGHLPLGTHGLRRGLHSYAALRLNSASLGHSSDGHRAMTKTSSGLDRFPLLPRTSANRFRPSGAGFMAFRSIRLRGNEFSHTHFSRAARSKRGRGLSASARLRTESDDSSAAPRRLKPELGGAIRHG